MNRFPTFTGVFAILISISSLVGAEEALHEKTLILHDESAALRPELWFAGDPSLTEVQATCLSDLHKTKLSQAEIFKRCKVKEGDLSRSLTRMKSASAASEGIRKDCEDRLFATTKISGSQIHTICEQEMLKLGKAQMGSTQRLDSGKTCESVSEREVVCGGKRYLRDRGSVLDGENVMKQVIDQVSDYSDTAAGTGKGRAAKGH